MRDYSVLGGVLRSELEFPELPTLNRPLPDWTLRIGDRGPPPGDLIQLGERRIGREIYRLFETRTGRCLEYSETGWYEISTDGALIVWHPRENANRELARWVVLGPVLAILLESAGFFCLHGSAVALGQHAIALVGPKHYGKSTLAIALTSGGGRLVADDLVAVDQKLPASVRPGVASVRLWADAARLLDLEKLCDTVIQGVKATATRFHSEVIAKESVPLSSVYLLDPVHTGDSSDVPVRRTPLRGAAAAITLAQQSKLADSLIGYRAAGARLAAATRTAASVPVWTLHVARGFEMLPKVVEQMLEWHPLEPAGPRKERS